MKQLLSVTLFVSMMAGTLIACAQESKENRPSPPAKATGKAGNATITIDYSSPSVKGRKIFGSDIAPYGKIWRAGANEATVFEVDQDVTVEGQKLPKGKYGFFAIPGETEWVIVFNKTWNQWGSYRYKQEEDVLRVKVKSGKTPSLVEKMVYTVNNGVVNLSWENTSVNFTVK
jgi:hypothetical protein